MPWCVARVQLSDDGEPGGMPDEIFGPFSTENKANAWADKTFKRVNGLARTTLDTDCACVDCLEDAADEAGLEEVPTGVVNFVVFKMRGSRNYENYY